MPVLLASSRGAGVRRLLGIEEGPVQSSGRIPLELRNYLKRSAMYTSSTESPKGLKKTPLMRDVPYDPQAYLYRGMRLDMDALENILENGMEVSRTRTQRIWLSYNALLAIRYAFNPFVFPGARINPRQLFLPVLFQLDKKRIAVNWNNEDILEVQGDISPEVISRLFVFDAAQKALVDITDRLTSFPAGPQPEKFREYSPVFVEGPDHAGLYAFVREKLPAVVGEDVVRQSTLIHVDFHPDTSEIVNPVTEKRIPLDQGNVLAHLHEQKNYQEAWWVHPPQAPYDKQWDGYAFRQIFENPRDLPATAQPVILSIDFDAFGSKEEGNQPLSEVYARIDSLLEVLEDRNYNVIGIFTTPSPGWTKNYIPQIRDED